MRNRVPYADPGGPAVSGPGRYLLWLVWKQRGRAALAVLWGSSWMVALMLPPALLSRAIDDGLRARDPAALVWWALVLLAVGGLNATLGILRHRTMTKMRTDARLRTVQLITRQAVRLGATLPRRTATGEVISVGTADVTRLGHAMTVTGPGVGAVVAYAAVTVLLLNVSPLLGAVVVLGVPVLAILVGPLLGRLQVVEGRYRDRLGTLTARAGDIVSGLRVLSGLGGKDRFADRYRADSAALRSEGYRVAPVTSWIEALAVGLPVVFLAMVTWLAARLAAAGDITVGELVAVYGYAAVLVVPVSFFIEAGHDIAGALVATRRVLRVLRLRPDLTDPADPLPAPDGPAELVDGESGLVVRPGRMVGVAATETATAGAIVDRLGRYDDGGVRWGGVHWGGVPLDRIPLDDVRRRLLVAENEAHLFAGPLRETLATHLDHDDAELLTACHTAAADDVLDALPDGLDSHVEARASNLSGGQRQRLRLARALLADPEVLLLVDPTSAVDAHTEARIADRLRAARGTERRTTVVASSSPLLLSRADEVAYVVGGMVAATGTHAELVAAEPGYRDLVLRGDEES